MNKTFEKIYSENNVILNKDMALKENTALFEKVYTEAEMLNEMNPKLRALLAAGLIGTAGLGATSCSTPNDDYEEPTPIEQPETPAETEDTKETEDTTFKAYGFEVTPEQAEKLARIKRVAEPADTFQKFPKEYTVLVYENSFVPVTLDPDTGNIKFYTPHIPYGDNISKTIFFIPAGDMADKFDDAIAVYKAAHAE